LTYYVAGAALMAGVVAESVHWGEIARAGLTQLDKGVPPSIYQPGKQDVFTGYRRRCAAYRQADEPRLSGRGRDWLEHAEGYLSGDRITEEVLRADLLAKPEASLLKWRDSEVGDPAWRMRVRQRSVTGANTL
jgi:hypothetical protein